MTAFGQKKRAREAQHREAVRLAELERRLRPAGPAASDPKRIGTHGSPAAKGEEDE